MECAFCLWTLSSRGCLLCDLFLHFALSQLVSWLDEYLRERAAESSFSLVPNARIDLLPYEVWQARLQASVAATLESQGQVNETNPLHPLAMAFSGGKYPTAVSTSRSLATAIMRSFGVAPPQKVTIRIVKL